MWSPLGWATDATGASADELKLILTFFLSYPLAAVLSQLPDDKPWQKNGFNASVSLFYLIAIFDLWDGLQTLIISSLGAYIIARYVQGPWMPWLGFLFLMSHMSINHVRRHIVNDATKVDITGAQMVLVMKLSAFCWNVYDGRQRRADLSEYQKMRSLGELPAFSDYLGYVLFFPSLFAGPAFDFMDYSRWIESREKGRSATPTATSQRKFEVQQQKSPAIGRPALIKAAIGIFWIALFVHLSKYYYVGTILNQSFSELNFMHKLWVLHMLGFTTRMKYYGVWYLTEGACVLSELGSKGVDPAKENQNWDHLRNVNPWGIETAQNSRGYLENWNINTNRWLRNYIYLRVTPKGQKPGFRASLITFATCAFWHGFEPGYYLSFILAAFLQTTAKNFRRFVRPIFARPDAKGPTRSKIIYDIVSFLATQAAFDFATVPFCVLDLQLSLQVWAQVKFYVLFATLICVCFFASPGRAWLQGLASKEVTEAKKVKLQEPNSASSDASLAGLLPEPDLIVDNAPPSMQLKE